MDKPIETYSYQDAQRVAQEFEKLLRSHSITVRSGSALETMTLSVFEIAYGRKESAVAYSIDLRKLFRHLVGLTDLCALILSVQDHPSFRRLLRHLALLNEGQGIQSDTTSYLDQASDKLFELFVACLVMKCGVEIELEDPHNSGGNNPDVLALIRGRRWGFACKVLHSLQPESIIQNIRKGIDQIERSPAEIGIVILSLKLVIKHDDYWGIANLEQWEGGAEPLYRCFATPDEPRQRLRHEVEVIGKALVDRAGDVALAQLFEGKKAVPAFLQWVHVASCFVAGVKPIPFSCRFFHLQEVVGTASEDERAVYECLSGAGVNNPGMV